MASFAGILTGLAIKVSAAIETSLLWRLKPRACGRTDGSTKAK